MMRTVMFSYEIVFTTQNYSNNPRSLIIMMLTISAILVWENNGENNFEKDVYTYSSDCYKIFVKYYKYLLQLMASAIPLP